MYRTVDIDIICRVVIDDLIIAAHRLIYTFSQSTPLRSNLIQIINSM